jgi:hypothetical protein
MWFRARNADVVNAGEKPARTKTARHATGGIWIYLAPKRFCATRSGEWFAGAVVW